MSDIPSLARRIQIEETDFRSPVSESTMQKVGGTCNYILDHFVVYSGMIIPWAGPESSVPPSSAYIICDGRAVSRTTYSNLFTAIGTYWGNGDAVTTFNVPDLRGLFLRMVDATGFAGHANRDPDHASRLPAGSGTAEQSGSVQGDDFGAHSHAIPFQSGTGPTKLDVQASFVSPANYASTTDLEGGNESRPKNAYIIYLIKT